MVLSNRTRIGIFLIAAFLMILGITALYFAFQPLSETAIHEIIPATLLAPP